jgi:hypothetical protein
MDKKLESSASPYNPTFSQIVIIIHQTIDFNMMFLYSLITNDSQIDEKHKISPRIQMKMWKKWPTS